MVHSVVIWSFCRTWQKNRGCCSSTHIGRGIWSLVERYCRVTGSEICSISYKTETAVLVANQLAGIQIFVGALDDTSELGRNAAPDV